MYFMLGFEYEGFFSSHSNCITIFEIQQGRKNSVGVQCIINVLFYFLQRLKQFFRTWGARNFSRLACRPYDNLAAFPIFFNLRTCCPHNLLHMSLPLNLGDIITITSLDSFCMGTNIFSASKIPLATVWMRWEYIFWHLIFLQFRLVSILCYHHRKYYQRMI